MCCWNEYFRYIADQLELKDWRFVIDGEAADDDANATVYTIYGQRFARFRLGECFKGDDRELQRYVVVHEWLHCHLGMAHDYAIGEIGKGRGRAFNRMVEHGIDAIARAIACHFNLPEIIVIGDTAIE